MTHFLFHDPRGLILIPVWTFAILYTLAAAAWIINAVVVFIGRMIFR